MRFQAGFALFALLFSACLGAPSPTTEPTTSPTLSDTQTFEPLVPPAPSFDFSKVIDPDHGAHQAPALHGLGHGLKVVGHTGISGILPQGMPGSISAIDVLAGFALVAGVDDRGPAFVIVDITHPAKPKPISYVATNAPGFTARFSKDGQYVFYGCQLIANPIRSDCTAPTEVKTGGGRGGILAYDVRDMTKPTLVAFVPTMGTHNIQTQVIDGVDYVFTDHTEIIRFDRDPAKLSIVATVPGRHDVTVMRHPATQDWLLYTGTNELAIYNVNDPTEPQEVLVGFPDAVGWHDQAPFPTLVDGRALLALAGEGLTGDGRVRPLRDVTIVDITDPEQPKVLSKWVPPFTPTLPWVEYQFSVHEMAATPQGQLAVAWYHAGIWVLDLSTQERQARPVVLAAYQPNNLINVVPAAQPDNLPPLVPYVWGAGWDQRGYLVIPDMHTGVYVLEPSWGLHRTLDGGQ